MLFKKNKSEPTKISKRPVRDGAGEAYLTCKKLSKLQIFLISCIQPRATLHIQNMTCQEQVIRVRSSKTVWKAIHLHHCSFLFCNKRQNRTRQNNCKTHYVNYVNQEAGKKKNLTKKKLRQLQLILFYSSGVTKSDHRYCRLTYSEECYAFAHPCPQLTPNVNADSQSSLTWPIHNPKL